MWTICNTRLPQIPPHLKGVATLPCETLVFKVSTGAHRRQTDTTRTDENVTVGDGRPIKHDLLFEALSEHIQFNAL